MRVLLPLMLSIPVFALPVTPAPATAAAVTLQPCGDQHLCGTLALTLKGADTERALSASLTIADPSWTGDAAVTPKSLTKGSTANVEVRIDIPRSKMPASGILILDRSSDAMVYNVSFKFQPRPKCLKDSDGARWASLAFEGPLVLAILVAIICAFMLSDKLTHRMGSATWDFSSSWATNVTLGGGLLTGVLGFSLFPDNGQFLSKPGYLAASVIFPVLAALAPQTYNIFRKPVDDPANPSGPPQLQGFVLGFVIAAAITAWASISQAAVTALAIAEIDCAGYLADALASPAIALLILLSLGLAVYVVTTVVFTVGHQVQNAVTARALLPGQQNVPLPNWRVL